MIHPVTGSKDRVLNAIQNAHQAFSDNNAVVRQKMAAAYPDPAKCEQARQRIVDGLQKAYLEASKAKTDAKWFTAQGAMSGIAQSAMNVRAENAQTAVASAAVSEHAAAPALAPFEQFGVLDPGWIECVIDAFKTAIEGKAAFVQHQNLNDFLFQIDDPVTIAIFGDWGADNDAAHRVAQRIRAANPDIAIHLGDIYYAGQENETESALKI